MSPSQSWPQKPAIFSGNSQLSRMRSFFIESGLTVALPKTFPELAYRPLQFETALLETEPWQKTRPSWLHLCSATLPSLCTRAVRCSQHGLRRSWCTRVLGRTTCWCIKAGEFCAKGRQLATSFVQGGLKAGRNLWPEVYLYRLS